MARGDAADSDTVFRSVPRIKEHRQWLEAAGIDYIDSTGRRADLHALRHTYSTLLSKSGVLPREAMSLMRHTDLRLTMKTYTDPRIFDLAGAVEKRPSILPDEQTRQSNKATGTDGNPTGRVDKMGVAKRVANVFIQRHSMTFNGNKIGIANDENHPVKPS